MKYMYCINYGTDEHYNKNVGNKYFCRSFDSMIKKLKQLLKKDGLDSKSVNRICDKRVLDYKTVFGNVFERNINVGEETGEYNGFINIYDTELY